MLLSGGLLLDAVRRGGGWMGIISDIKQELRKVNALKINYTTRVGDYTQNLN